MIALTVLWDDDDLRYKTEVPLLYCTFICASSIVEDVTMLTPDSQRILLCIVIVHPTMSVNGELKGESLRAVGSCRWVNNRYGYYNNNASYYHPRSAGLNLHKYEQKHGLYS